MLTATHMSTKGPVRLRRGLAVGALTLYAALWLHGDSGRSPSFRIYPAVASPRVMLWAWEEPEDLRGLDPYHAGVAFLAERLFLGDTVRRAPRRQPILTPKDIYAVAVVRIEVGKGFIDSKAIREQTAGALLEDAKLPGVRGLQVDFDATASQHSFYADILKQVRSRLPAGQTLTITALVSWCAEEGTSPKDWLRQLPVDQAIPMEFRLGKQTGNWAIREPLCQSTLGIATDEPLRTSAQTQLTSAGLAAKTLYIFSPRPWTPSQLSILNSGNFMRYLNGGNQE